MKIFEWLYQKLVKDNTLTQGLIAHLPHGVFTTFAAIYIHWSIALIFGIGFIVFELDQDWYFKDGAHNDLAGWLLWMAVSAIAYWALI